MHFSPLKKILRSQLRLNMFSGTVLTTTNIIAGLVVYPVYLYFLGAETYGFWLLLAVVLNFSRLGMLGIPTAMTKLVAEVAGQKDTTCLERYTSTALTLVCGSGIVIVLLVFLFRIPIVHLFGLPQEKEALACFYLPLIALLSSYVFIAETISSFLSGLGRMDQANYIQSLGRIVTPVVSSLLLFCGCGLASMVIGNAVGYLIVHIMSLFCIKKIQPMTMIPSIRWEKAVTVRILQFGGGISGMTFLNMFLGPFNKIILSRYVGLETVPVYEIGYRIANQLRSFFHISFKALLPEVSKGQSQLIKNRIKKIQSNINNSIKLIICLGLPLYSILFIIATPLLKIWLGHNFIETMPMVTRILLVSSFMVLLATPYYFTLLAMGNVRFCLFTSLVQTGLNVFIITSTLVLDFRITIFHVTTIYSFSIIFSSLLLILTGHYFLKKFET